MQNYYKDTQNNHKEAHLNYRQKTPQNDYKEMFN